MTIRQRQRAMEQASRAKMFGVNLRETDQLYDIEDRMSLAEHADALAESRESFYEELDKLPLVKGGQGRPDWTPDASFTVLDVAIVAACVVAGFAVLAATARGW